MSYLLWLWLMFHQPHGFPPPQPVYQMQYQQQMIDQPKSVVTTPHEAWPTAQQPVPGHCVMVSLTQGYCAN